MYAYTVYMYAVPVMLTLAPWMFFSISVCNVYACMPHQILQLAGCLDCPACKDLDVDSDAAFESSEWLRANVWLDKLGPGDTCYIPGERQHVLMADVPPLTAIV